jgi:hypothetical protein
MHDAYASPAGELPVAGVGCSARVDMPRIDVSSARHRQTRRIGEIATARSTPALTNAVFATTDTSESGACRPRTTGEV